MGKMRDWLSGLVGGGKMLPSEGVVNVVKFPPDILQDIEAETREALLDGRIRLRDAATFEMSVTDDPKEAAAIAADHLAENAHYYDDEEENPLSPPEEDSYPISDPKEPVGTGAPMSPNMNPDYGYMVVGSTSEADQPEVKKPETPEPEPSPLGDTLPQFLRPEVALRKLPLGSRAPLNFIRQVIELLREAFPDVKDKYWILEESTALVSVALHVNARRDIILHIGPQTTKGLVRERGGQIIDQISLSNDSWTDFIGWVSLAKVQAEKAYDSPSPE